MFNTIFTLAVAFLVAFGLTVVGQCVGLTSNNGSWVVMGLGTVVNFWLFGGLGGDEVEEPKRKRSEW